MVRKVWKEGGKQGQLKGKWCHLNQEELGKPPHQKNAITKKGKTTGGSAGAGKNEKKTPEKGACVHPSGLEKTKTGSSKENKEQENVRMPGQKPFERAP